MAVPITRLNAAVGCFPALVLFLLTGCQGGGLSAVERIALNTIEPTVTLVGEIVVESAAAVPDSAQVVLTFIMPPDTAVLETHILAWRRSYLVPFFHDQVCSWSLSVTIWDGRRSQSRPVSETPQAPCVGFITGPSFWFP